MNLLCEDLQNIIYKDKWKLYFRDVMDEMNQRFKHKYLNTHIRFLNEYHDSMFDTQHKYDHYYHENGK